MSGHTLFPVQYGSGYPRGQRLVPPGRTPHTSPPREPGPLPLFLLLLLLVKREGTQGKMVLFKQIKVFKYHVALFWRFHDNAFNMPWLLISKKY
jgi:hypothetical protein